MRLIFYLFLFAVAQTGASANIPAETSDIWDIPLFKCLEKSPPREYLKFKHDLESVDNSVTKNAVVIEFYTDNMVSYGAVILAKNAHSISVKNPRIHVIPIVPNQYENYISSLKEIDARFAKTRTIDFYKITHTLPPNPIRYFIFNFEGRSFAVLGTECLQKIKQQCDTPQNESVFAILHRILD